MDVPARGPVRVSGFVETPLYERLAALEKRHGVSLEAVVGAAVALGLPLIEKWKVRSGPGGPVVPAANPKTPRAAAASPPAAGA